MSGLSLRQLIQPRAGMACADRQHTDRAHWLQHKYRLLPRILSILYPYSSCLPHPDARGGSAGAGAIVATRGPVIFLFRHHGPEAPRHLVASAMATTMRGFRARMRVSQPRACPAPPPAERPLRPRPRACGITLPHLRRLAQPGFAARRWLWHQPGPRPRTPHAGRSPDQVRMSRSKAP